MILSPLALSSGLSVKIIISELKGGRVQVVEAAEAALRHLARLGHVLRGDVRLAVRAIHSLAEQQLGAVRVP